MNSRATGMKVLWVSMLLPLD